MGYGDGMGDDPEGMEDFNNARQEKTDKAFVSLTDKLKSLKDRTQGGRDMKRYRVGVKHAGDGTSFVGAAIEFERGEYVLHSDHEAALAEAVADAERYRWLREHADGSFRLSFKTPTVDNNADNDEYEQTLWGRMAPEYLDQTIDAAIDAARKEGA